MNKTVVIIDGVIFDTYPHGGIARIYREVLPRIADKNPNIHFYVTCLRKSDLLPKHKQIQPISVGYYLAKLGRYFPKIEKLHKLLVFRRLRRLKATVFQSTYYTQAPISGVRKVVMIYDLIDFEYPWFMPNGPDFVQRQKQIVESADSIVGISKNTFDLAKEAFTISSKVPVSIMHLGASEKFQILGDTERDEFRSRYVDGAPFFLFVGATGTYKNLATLLKAFSKIHESTSHRLVLVGHSVARLGSHLLELAIELKIEKRLVRLASPSDEILVQAYNAADAFVFPSLQEGFGIPLVEAMKCGTPILASDIEVFREVCDDCALYFDPHNAEDLALRMQDIVVPEIRDDLREKSLEKAESYSWETAADVLENVYLHI